MIRLDLADICVYTYICRKVVIMNNMDEIIKICILAKKYADLCDTYDENTGLLREGWESEGNTNRFLIKQKTAYIVAVRILMEMGKLQEIHQNIKFHDEDYDAIVNGISEFVEDIDSTYECGQVLRELYCECMERSGWRCNFYDLYDLIEIVDSGQSMRTQIAKEDYTYIQDIINIIDMTQEGEDFYVNTYEVWHNSKVAAVRRILCENWQLYKIWDIFENLISKVYHFEVREASQYRKMIYLDGDFSFSTYDFTYLATGEEVGDHLINPISIVLVVLLSDLCDMILQIYENQEVAV